MAQAKIMKQFIKNGGGESNASSAKKKKTYPSYHNVSCEGLTDDNFFFGDEWDTSNKNGMACTFHCATAKEGEPGYFDLLAPQLTTAFKGFSAFDESKGEHQFELKVYNKDIECVDFDVPVQERIYRIKEGVTGNDLLLAQEALKFYVLVQQINVKALKKALETAKNNTKKTEIQATYNSLIKSFYKEGSEYPRIEFMTFALNHSFEENPADVPEITTTFFKMGNDSALKPISWEDVKRMTTGGAEVILSVFATRLWVGSKTSLKFKIKSLIVVEESTGGEGGGNGAVPVLPPNMVIVKKPEVTEGLEDLAHEEIHTPLGGFVTSNGTFEQIN